MGTDNRSYKRFKIHIPTLVYDGNGYKEIECEVKDISEHGIAFEIYPFYYPAKTIFQKNSLYA